MDNYDVSVIVAVYNTSEYLLKCLRCFEKCPNYDRLQIIIIDDCSRDDSPEIIKKWADGRNNVLTICKEKNEGTFLSRIDGMLQATGKYACFIDSDDYFEPDMFVKLYDAAEMHAADIVESGIYIERGGEKEKHHDFAPGRHTTKEVMKSFAQRTINSALWLRIYKLALVKKVLEKVDLMQVPRDDFEGIRNEDETLTPLFIMEANNYVVLEDYLYHYIEATTGSIMMAIEEKPEKKCQHAKTLITAGERLLSVSDFDYTGIVQSMQINNMFYMLGHMIKHNLKDEDSYLRNAIKRFRMENKNLTIKNRFRLTHLRLKYGQVKR